MELVKYETDEHALCTYETDEHALSEILSREKKMEQRRRDQELHAHKNIWTKEAHGGRYINTHANQGYDPLLEDKTGRSLTFPPGYERTKRGPTTNFVGNHMTQGAIDLVQMELQPVKQDLKRIELNPRAEEGPHVSDSPEALRVDAPAFVPVQHYAWQDKGTYVQLQITTTHHLAGSTHIGFGPHRFSMQYVEQDIAEGSEPSHRGLAINPLYAEVVPEQCQLSVACHEDRGTMLPNMTSAAASALVPANPAQKIITVFLAKADPAITWERLASEVQPVRFEVDVRADAARLVLIRKALRAQKKPQQPMPAERQLLQICY